MARLRVAPQQETTGAASGATFDTDTNTNTVRFSGSRLGESPVANQSHALGRDRGGALIHSVIITVRVMEPREPLLGTYLTGSIKYRMYGLGVACWLMT